MSKRNLLLNKRLRKETPRPLAKTPRAEPEIPNEVTSEVLTNPKLKNSAAFRKTMLRARQRVVQLTTTPAKSFEVLVAEFAKTRNANQLSQHITRYGRTLKHLPPKLEAVEKALAAYPTSLDLQAAAANLRLIILDARTHFNACQTEFLRRCKTKAI